MRPTTRWKSFPSATEGRGAEEVGPRVGLLGCPDQEPQMPISRSQRRAFSLTAIALILGVLGCGGSSGRPATAEREGRAPDIEWIVPARSIPGLRQRFVGHGPRGAAVLWPAGSPPPRTLVIFMHAWQALPPSAEARWIAHLAREGTSVVYPAYQSSATPTRAFLGNAMAGIASALRALHLHGAPTVVVGRTTGGALAFAYAATAAAHDLPVPSGVLAVFPGRRPPGGEIPAPDLDRIAPGTELIAVSGPGDPLPGGEAEARALLAAAGRVHPGDRHLERPRLTPARGAGPLTAMRRREQQALWAPADRLIARAREKR